MNDAARRHGARPVGERKYDLYGPDFKRDPYPTFSAMRRDDPIYQQPGLDGKTPIWFVTRYADVEAMLRDKRFVRDASLALPPDRIPTGSALDRRLGQHMLNADGADHRRLRDLVSQAFTPKRVADLRPRTPRSCPPRSKSSCATTGRWSGR